MGTTYCGEDVLRAAYSSLAAPTLYWPAFAFSLHSLSSRTQSVSKGKAQHRKIMENIVNTCNSLKNQNIYDIKMLIAHSYLKTVSQVTVSIREVRFQFKSHSIALNCFRNISTILVNTSQVAVSISKGRIYLYSPGITLHSSLYILHFLQCVAHVWVGISKGRWNSTRRQVGLSYTIIDFCLLLHFHQHVSTKDIVMVTQ